MKTIGTTIPILISIVCVGVSFIITTLYNASKVLHHLVVFLLALYSIKKQIFNDTFQATFVNSLMAIIGKIVDESFDLLFYPVLLLGGISLRRAMHKGVHIVYVF